MHSTDSDSGRPHSHPHPHPHQHQHHQPSLPARTPFSVADLLSRPPDAAYQHRTVAPAPRPSVQRTFSRSTPPPPPPLSAAADPAWTAVNHASPQVSPTTTQLAPIASDSHPANQLLPNFATLSNPPLAPSEVSPTPNSAPRSLTPTSQRQDSAVYQQRIDTPKDALVLGLSSDAKPYHSHQSPNGSVDSTSPTSNSYPNTPLSPQSLNHVPLHTGMYNQPKGPASTQHSTQRSPVMSEPELRSTKSTSSVDNTGASHTRQLRYNVRFNQAYTLDNMPPSQRPRNDHQPLPTVPSTESAEPQPRTPERPITPTTAQAMSNNAQQSEEQSPEQSRRDDPSVERCKHCNEVWKRPIPTVDQYSNRNEQLPARNNDDLARNSMDLIARLRNFGNQADAAYDRWCYRHRFCVPPPAEADSPSSPDEANSRRPQSGSEGGRRDSRIADIPGSNKRKSDVPHDSERTINPKSRRVTFQTQKT